MQSDGGSIPFKPTALYNTLSPSLRISPENVSKVQPYIARLSTLSLQELQTEPATLSAESAVLTTSLTTLCHNEYQTFLSLRDTSTTIVSSFNSFAEGLDSLLATIPELETMAQEFITQAKDVRDERRETIMILEQQDKLLDILEIPQLADTCVRNGYYQEALDLSLHTQKLAQRYSGVSLVRDIEAEVGQATQLMISQLFLSLRGIGKLPTFVKSISFLRRLSGLDEVELGLAFLSSRFSHLQGQLNGILKESSEPSQCLRRYIDLWREGTNDVTTQFQTIFLSRDSDLASLAELQDLLAIMLNRLMDDMLNLLNSKLPLVGEPTSLTSLLTQLTYCSLSFSKIGMDFRSLLPPIFESAVLQMTRVSLDKAADRFGEGIRNAGKEHALPSSYLLAPGVSVDAVQVEQPTMSHTPPTFLVSLPPFAHYLNDLISTLNQLRLFAPTSAVSSLLELFEGSLAASARIIIKYAQEYLADENSVDITPLEQQRVLQFSGNVFIDVIIPFIRKALVESVFGVELDNIGYSQELDACIREWHDWVRDSCQGSASP